MADGKGRGPATETRGGQAPDWARVKPGEALPEAEAQPDPGTDG